MRTLTAFLALLPLACSAPPVPTFPGVEEALAAVQCKPTLVA